MIYVLIAAVVLAVAVAGFVLWRRRSSKTPVVVPDVVPRAATAFEFPDRLDEAGRLAVENALVAADLGVATTGEIVAIAARSQPRGVVAVRDAVRSALLDSFGTRDRSLHVDGSPAVVVVVGVNGSGKTTAIARLAHLLQGEGKSVLLGAADTFRAAAIDQLRVWAERIGADLVASQPGSDPASVAFDAVAAGAARGRDVVIVDTAGRLHDKKNLMEELGKVVRVAGKEHPVTEVLLVIDGTTGANGIAQAEAFTEAVGVTGVVVTKLDGTARGGMAVAIERRLGLPIKLVGFGEGFADMRHFDPEAHVDRILEVW